MAVNDPVIDNTEAVGEDKPGLHALVIGLSNYQYLSDDNKPFGFKKVQGPAASALALAHWLEQADAQGILALRLKTLRLLWLPTDAEQAPASPLAAKAAGTLADAESARTTIEAWRDACKSDQDNVALFYFAGHGVNASTDDVYLAMGDVGHPDDSIDSIRRCIRVKSIFDAMAPSQRQMNMALKQFYFIDACRTFSPVEDEDADMKIGSKRVSNGADARAAPIYFGANSGEPAFADDATGTRFGKALLRVLSNSSADGRVDDATGAIVYPINTDSLRAAINNAMGQGEIPPKGHVKNAELVLLKNAPQIDVSVLVRPEDKAPNVYVDIFNLDRNCVICTIKPVVPNACVVKASVGRHRLDAYWMDPLAPIGALPPKTFVGPIERLTVIARTAARS